MGLAAIVLVEIAPRRAQMEELGSVAKLAGQAFQKRDNVTGVGVAQFSPDLPLEEDGCLVQLASISSGYPLAASFLFIVGKPACKDSISNRDDPDE